MKDRGAALAGTSGASAADRDAVPHTSDLERLLTIADLAERLQLSEKTIRRMISRRRLPCIRLGRQIRFVRGDVFRWLEARKEG